jgi:hypothetical protein|nr:MAG TPA: hypothetical protein [Crassvirales sp.]
MTLILSLIILFISAYIFYSYFQNIWIIVSETISFIVEEETVLMLTNKELLIILLLFLFSPITMYCTKKYLDKIYYG